MDKPNTFDTYNTGARLDYDLPKTWHAFAQGGFSHSLIDDNVVYAYGCGYEQACQGTAPQYFFAPTAATTSTTTATPASCASTPKPKRSSTGQVRTAALTHVFAAGGELFRRSVQQPGAPPSTAPGTVQDGAVYTYVGSENIYQPIVPLPIENPVQSAGPRALWEDNHQTAGWCRIGFSYPDASSCWPRAASIPCATTITR